MIARRHPLCFFPHQHGFGDNQQNRQLEIGPQEAERGSLSVLIEDNGVGLPADFNLQSARVWA